MIFKKKKHGETLPIFVLKKQKKITKSKNHKKRLITEPIKIGENCSRSTQLTYCTLQPDIGERDIEANKIVIVSTTAEINLTVFTGLMVNHHRREVMAEQVCPDPACGKKKINKLPTQINSSSSFPDQEQPYHVFGLKAVSPPLWDHLSTIFSS